jgi:hypothetical protein
MRIWLAAIVLVFLIAPVLFWHEMATSGGERPGSLQSLIDLRTETTPDHKRVRIQGRLHDAISCVSRVSVERAGQALLLVIDATLPLFAGSHPTSSFDATFDIPPGVTEIRLGRADGDVLWRRDECLRRYEDRGGKWHCD